MVAAFDEIMDDLRRTAARIPWGEGFHRWRNKQIDAVDACRGLTATAKRIYAILIRRFLNTQETNSLRGLAWPGQAKLAELAGCSEASVTRAIADLKRNSIIIVGPQMGPHRANLIAFPALDDDLILKSSRRQIDFVKRSKRGPISSRSASDLVSSAPNLDPDSRRRKEKAHRRFEEALGAAAYHMDYETLVALSERYQGGALDRFSLLNAFQGTEWLKQAENAANSLQLPHQAKPESRPIRSLKQIMGVE